MRKLTRAELFAEKKKIIPQLKDKIFIFPTDHGYSIGCDANNSELIQKIRDAKSMRVKPLAIIPPSVKWIKENCELKNGAEEELGLIEHEGEPHCVILELNLKNKEAISNKVNNNGKKLNVKMPEHWITDFVKELGYPIVSTSANVAGEDFITKIDYLNDDLRSITSFAIKDTNLLTYPVKRIDLS